MAKKHAKDLSWYVDGFDFTTATLSIASFGTTYGATLEGTFGTSVMAIKADLDQAVHEIQGINALLDSAAVNGLHTVQSVANGTAQLHTLIIGSISGDSPGDVTFSVEQFENVYQANPSNAGAIPVTLSFAKDQSNLDYSDGFGRLLHPEGAEAASNGGTADYDNGASSARGGLGYLHVLSGDGTATFTIEHSAVDADANFDATGAIVTFDTTAAATPFGEMKATATHDTTVEQYLRWQVVLGTATAITFVMGFIRGK